MEWSLGVFICFSVLVFKNKNGFYGSEFGLVFLVIIVVFSGWFGIGFSLGRFFY